MPETAHIYTTNLVEVHKEKQQLKDQITKLKDQNIRSIIIINKLKVEKEARICLNKFIVGAFY